MGGFECSCHRRRDGRRLDLSTATGHERWVVADYARLRSLGIGTVREGIAWFREAASLASVRTRARAARNSGIQVIWDLCHFGWPEEIDIFRPAFVDRFAAFAKSVAEVVAGESDETPFYVPVNEISFWSWAGGEVGFLNPFSTGRGFELKAQLARAALAATAAVWSVDPRARVLQVEPLIHIETDPARPEESLAAQGHREAHAEFLDAEGIVDYVLWYYTPMAIALTVGLKPRAVVYDCMDELSLFRGAPQDLLRREEGLLAQADLVFTGGQSLYEAKRGRHPSVHAFPSSIEAAHFAQAREAQPEPVDQAGIPRPRLGYFGVIDERIDLDLLAALADSRPEWQIVLLGPVVKIDPVTLPRRENLRYLGMKSYAELPAYLAGWDVALLPFARNESTRFISPTKTPEYLAGGCPVVSTSIRDVVRPYGELGLVEIADEPGEVVMAIERCLAAVSDSGRRDRWLCRVDELLAGGSWDRTHRSMSDLIDLAVLTRRAID